MKEAKLALAVGAVALALSPAAQSIEKPREPRKPRTPAQVRPTTTTTPATPAIKEAGTGRDARAPSPRPTSLPARTSPSTVPGRIAAAWPGSNPQEAIRVARCESAGTFDPSIWNQKGSGAAGLFQAMPRFWATYGGLEYAPNPTQATVEQQTLVAWRGYQDRGWSPWVCQP